MTATNTQVTAALSQFQNIVASNPQLAQLIGGGAGATGAAGTAAAAPAAGAGTAAAGGIGVDQASQPLSIPGTGKLEKRLVNGVVKYFEAAPVGQTAKEISAFKYINALRLDIPIDYRPGLATGLANLSNVFNARSERTRLLSSALAEDANVKGSIDQVDLMKLQMENTTTEQLAQIQKSIFDSMKNAIQAWLR